MNITPLTKLILAEFNASLGHDVTETADFFDQGGDSIAVEIVLTKLSETLALDLQGWLLLDNPTAAQLGHAIHKILHP
jgi:hypothetical protein